MSAIITWLAESWLGKLIMKYVWDKISNAIISFWALMRRWKEIDAQAKKEADAVKNAKDEDELEKAAQDILGRK